MSDRMLKIKACEHTSRTLVFSSGEDAPGKSLDTCEQCNTCGAVIHDYRYGGGLRSPNYPIVRQSPLLEPFLAVCQQLIEAERARPCPSPTAYERDARHQEAYKRACARLWQAFATYQEWQDDSGDADTFASWAREEIPNLMPVDGG